MTYAGRTVDFGPTGPSPTGNSDGRIFFGAPGAWFERCLERRPANLGPRRSRRQCGSYVDGRRINRDGRQQRWALDHGRKVANRRPNWAVPETQGRQFYLTFPIRQRSAAKISTGLPVRSNPRLPPFSNGHTRCDNRGRPSGISGRAWIARGGAMTRRERDPNVFGGGPAKPFRPLAERGLMCWCFATPPAIDSRTWK